MSATNKTLAPYRTWKVKPYTPSLETRIARERAEQAQPPLISLHTSKHGKTETPPPATTTTTV